MNVWGVNAEGLGRNDFAYFRMLEDGPRGLGTLVNALGVGTEEIERDIESYLMQLGLIDITVGGRMLTQKGHEYIRTRLTK